MPRQLTVYYTSDTHGYFSPVDYAANAAAPTGLSCCAASFRKDGNTLIIDGGDTLQGSPFTYWLSRQEPGSAGPDIPAALMNLAGYDFVTLGNHDFNYGREPLERYLNSLSAVCLCANVEGLPAVRKTALVTLANGLRVGLTGIVTDFINIWEKPEHLVGITVSDPVAAARSALAELKAAGAELTVCIYHGGFERDLQTGRLLSDTGENRAWEICRDLDFDLLLTGHQHMALESAELFGTHSCQPPDKARSFIRCTVTVEDLPASPDAGNTRSPGSSADTGKPAAAAALPSGPSAAVAPARHIETRLIPAGDAVHPEMAAFLEPLDQEISAWLDRPVGHLDCPLVPDSPIRMAACGSLIANFFNQVQLWASGAELSVTCLGNEIRGFEREISIRDVVATYIYPNTLCTLRVSREVLRQALERSAEYFDLDEKGALRVSEHFLRPKVEHYNFDYFAGIEVTVDISAPFGQRVTSIRRNGRELTDAESLTLCLNNYRASGAGGYECYTGCEVVKNSPTEIVELIMDYISCHPEITVDKTQWLHLILPEQASSD